MHFCDDDAPGEHPEEIGAEGLVEVPAGTGGKEDGGELGLERVEDVAPVNVLGEVLVGGFGSAGFWEKGGRGPSTFFSL